MTEAAPGWYQISADTLRWWDGQTWGTYTIPALPTRPSGSSHDTTLATLSHASFFVLPLIGPILIRVLGDKSDEFTRHNSTEALNFHIVYQVVYLTTGLAALVGWLSSSNDGQPPGWFFVAVFAGVGSFLAAFAFTILAIVRTAAGRWFRYPISIRFVPGAVKGDRSATAGVR